MTVRVELLLCAAEPLSPDVDVDVDALRPLALPSLGDDTQLHGTEAGTDAMRRCRHGLYLCVREGPGQLELAQRRAAEAVEAIAARHLAARASAGPPPVDPALVVVDLVGLDARPVLEAVPRLRSAALVDQLWIGLRPETEQRASVETFGFRKLGAREIHVPEVARDHVDVVVRFLNKLFDYARTTGQAIEPLDAVPFGWLDMRLLPAEQLAAYPDEPADGAPRFAREVLEAAGAEPWPGVLVVAEPTEDAPGSTVRVGAERAAGIVAQMVEVARRCGYEGGVDVPRALQTAVVCRRVADHREVQARRMPPDEPAASGWVAICGDADHDHEAADSFEVLPLVALAERTPRVFSLLAAPVGTAVTLGADGTATVSLP